MTITSPEEQKLIESLNTQNSKLWIGGYKNSAGQWCWVTGEPWEYQNWGDGEPNNSSNVVADESCVAVWPVKWNDLANSNTYEQSGYVCEWEASDAAEETQVEGYTGHVYEFYTLPESEWESGPITWQQAERRCEWKGGHLAIIESSTENFLLYSAMKAKGTRMPTLVTAIKALKETGNGSMEPAQLIQIGILVSRTIRMVLSTMQCSMKIFRMGHGMMQME